MSKRGSVAERLFSHEYLRQKRQAADWFKKKNLEKCKIAFDTEAPASDSIPLVRAISDGALAKLIRRKKALRGLEVRFFRHRMSLRFWACLRQETSTSGTIFMPAIYRRHPLFEMELFLHELGHAVDDIGDGLPPVKLDERLLSQYLSRRKKWRSSREVIESEAKAAIFSYRHLSRITGRKDAPPTFSRDERQIREMILP